MNGWMVRVLQYVKHANGGYSMPEIA